MGMASDPLTLVPGPVNVNVPVNLPEKKRRRSTPATLATPSPDLHPRHLFIHACGHGHVHGKRAGRRSETLRLTLTSPWLRSCGDVKATRKTALRRRVPFSVARSFRQITGVGCSGGMIGGAEARLSTGAFAARWLCAAARPSGSRTCSGWAGFRGGPFAPWRFG